LFNLVSSAHFLTEILTHVAIGLTLGFESKSWWILTGYVGVSHVVRAQIRQRWFRKKFEDFPANTRAIFPYVL
jgi:hypothetical protein